MWLLMMLAGTLFMALAVNLFFIPLRLADGGAIGISLIVEFLTGVPTWFTYIIVNIPIAVLGWRTRGRTFVNRTVLGIGLFSFMIAVTDWVGPPTGEPVLGMVYGGVFMGIGLGLVLRSGGTTGGTEMLATILHHHLGFSVGSMLLIIDALVLTAAGLFFGPERAMYAAITLAISSRLVDFIQEGFYGAKGVMIITTRPQEVAGGILKELNRGCTILPAVGAYTGESRQLLYSVVQRTELTAMKRIVYGQDPRAFVVVGDVREVLGEGFRRWE